MTTAPGRPVLLPNELVERLTARVLDATGDPAVAELFAACLPRTPAQAVRVRPDGTTTVITGDIPAMWLRDSCTQLIPYLALVGEHPELADVIGGLLRTQFGQILHDPYANAFNLAPDGGHHDDADLCDDPWIWEQKYEIDSLAHPLLLAHRWWRLTGRTDPFDDVAHRAMARIVATWRTEQDHEGSSRYRFVRLDEPASETLQRDGRGTPVARTGMTWSGFRPSDDACELGHNVPENLFAAVTLGHLAEMAEEVFDDAGLAADARALRAELLEGVERHGTVEHPRYGRIYAYEVDGLGGSVLMDDANVPSLLALPLLGAVDRDDPLYRATRAFVLSEDNPYFCRGAAASGVGSPHTEPDHVWPIAIVVAALTADDPAEELAALRTLAATHDGTLHVHESFHVDDPSSWSREWFSWGDAMLVELALHHAARTGAPRAAGVPEVQPGS